MVQPLADSSGFAAVIELASDDLALTLPCAGLFIPHDVLTYWSITSPNNGPINTGVNNESEEREGSHFEYEDEVTSEVERILEVLADDCRRDYDLDDGAPKGNCSSAEEFRRELRTSILNIENSQTTTNDALQVRIPAFRASK